MAPPQSSGAIRTTLMPSRVLRSPRVASSTSGACVRQRTSASRPGLAKMDAAEMGAPGPARTAWRLTRFSWRSSRAKRTQTSPLSTPTRCRSTTRAIPARASAMEAISPCATSWCAAAGVSTPRAPTTPSSTTSGLREGGLTPLPAPNSQRAPSQC